MIYLTDLENIAKVDMQTGDIFLNKSIFPYLPLNYQNFIIAHEKGHFVLQTDSELEADEYAFKQIAGETKFSLIDSVQILSEMLPFTDKEHNTRFLHAIKRAALYDLEQNNNSETQNLINKIDMYLNNDSLQHLQKSNEYIFPAVMAEEETIFDFPSFDLEKPKEITKTIIEAETKSPIELDGAIIEKKELSLLTDVNRDFARPIDLIKPMDEIEYKLPIERIKHGLPTPEDMESEDLTDIFIDENDEDSFFEKDTIQSDDITDLFANDTDNDDMFTNTEIVESNETSGALPLPKVGIIKEWYNKALDYYKESGDTTKIIMLIAVVLIAYKILK